jgi:Flp pilus assembly protein TadG
MPPRNPLHGAAHPRGVAIVWFAFFLLFVLGFIALGIDFAKLMATRTQLQNAADAAALGGATAIDYQTGTLVQATAVTRAQQTASQNRAFIEDSEPVVVPAMDVSFPAANQVRVVTRREDVQSIVAHFAQVFGLEALQMTADATAKVEPAGAVTCGLVPLAAIPPTGQNFQTGCGNYYTLKEGGGSGTTGNYGAIQYPSCGEQPCSGMNPSGAATYECLLKYGYCCTVTLGQTLSTQTGNISGKTRDAIQYRFNQDSVKTQNICYSQYKALGGDGSRVVYVPITSGFAGPGNTTVTVQTFGAFFLRNIPGTGNKSDILAEFVDIVVPGTGGGNNNGTAFAVRLIE